MSNKSTTAAIQQELDFKRSFRLVKLSPRDAGTLSDEYQVFRSKVLESESMYPGIDHWLDRKVRPGIRSSQRAAFVGYLDGDPVATAVVKRGESSKFCHLKLAPHIQDKNLGELFFGLMTLEVQHQAQEIHFTLPEGLWESKREFFTSFGFESIGIAGRQYRLFEQELRCVAPFEVVWRNVAAKLPKLFAQFKLNGFSPKGGIVMSLHPKFAASIMEGRKTVEVRRNFHTKWIGHRVSVYASSPVQAIVGDAYIAAVIPGSPKEIWDKFGSKIACTENEFRRYAAAKNELFAIQLADVNVYPKSMPIGTLSSLVERKLKAPQSYQSLRAGTTWEQAASIAAFLHARI